MSDCARRSLREFVDRAYAVRAALYELHAERLRGGKHSVYACWRLHYVHAAKWRRCFVEVGSMLADKVDGDTSGFRSHVYASASFNADQRVTHLAVAKVVDAIKRRGATRG